jgi:Zn-dependent oligopeptidase
MNKSRLEPQPGTNHFVDEKYKAFLEMERIWRKTKKSNCVKLIKKIAKTSLQFGENVAETKLFNCILRMKRPLGLPEGTIETARSLAKSEGRRVFTLDYPSYIL